MTTANTTDAPAVIEAAQDLLGSLESVFGEDWEFTKSQFQNIDGFVRDHHTFLEPGVQDEGDNWNNRAGLLGSVRRMREALGQAAQPPADYNASLDGERLAVGWLTAYAEGGKVHVVSDASERGFPHKTLELRLPQSAAIALADQFWDAIGDCKAGVDTLDRLGRARYDGRGYPDLALESSETRAKYGAWKIAGDLLAYPVSDCHDYEISLSQADTPAKALDWVLHISEKSWGAAAIPGLVAILRDRTALRHLAARG